MTSFKVGHVVLLAGGTVALYLLLSRLASLRSASPQQSANCSRLEHPSPESSTHSVQLPRGVRLRQVYPPAESSTKTDVDIIAIHGLDTKSPDTWIWEPKGADVNWLEDPHMLPKRFPTARIFTCDWPADLLDQPDFIQKTIEEFARLLLAGLKSRPPAANGHPAGKDRPTVFIASCLGGVILMKALVMANQEYLSVRKATRGIVFLATPFRGTAFQDVAKWAKLVLTAWALVQGKEVSNLVEHTTPTFDLGELVRSFTALCRDEDLSDHVFTFYETGKSSLLRKVAPWLSDFLSQAQPLVDKFSATLDFIQNPLPLDRPHVLMNKFSGSDDSGYISVAGTLEILLCEVRSGNVVDKADVWIRNKRYTADRLKIERLSGDPLPMDRCYINLAIVEQPGGKEDRLIREDGQRSSPFSLAARLNIKTPEKDVQVDLRTLFKTRERPGHPTIEPRRILIRGRAGVGKTTLCKKIVYDFSYGEMWRDLFDRLLWVPLRNLKRVPEDICTLGGLFFQEYFSVHPNGNVLAQGLWDALDAAAFDRTLFVLDGLDEISDGLHEDSRTFSLLQFLLTLPAVIVTSRPHVSLPDWLKGKFELELETIGFYPDQVDTYVEKSFTDPSKVGDVQSFLQRHPLIQGLVRIPIQLDALRYTWDGSSSQTVQETMTAVYQAMERKLWRKDVVRLERRSQGQTQDALPIEINTSVKDIICFLEVLAFAGMHNNIIDFQPKHLGTILEQSTPLETKLSLYETLSRTSFLRTSDPSSKDSSHHFLHLTFQEYFAARYFVRQWNAEQPLNCLTLGKSNHRKSEPVTFLREHKYNARYDIFWRFVAGLFSSQGEERIFDFFKRVEEEPLDLLGPMHQRLVMHCLSEVPPRNEKTDFGQFQTKQEERLLQWLLFECSLSRDVFLAREAEFPENALLTALREGSPFQKQSILEALVSREYLPERTVAALIGLLQDLDLSVRSAAAEALENQSTLSETTVAALIGVLQDSDSHVRYTAAKILGNQPTLSETTIAALIGLLQDSHSDVQFTAAEALRNQPTLSETTVAALIGLLQDSDSAVRYTVAEALRNQLTLSETTVAALIGLLRHSDLAIRYTAAETLENQLTLSETTVAALIGLLQNSDSHVRYTAAKAFWNQSTLSETTVAALIGLLQDLDWSVRSAAAKALGNQSTLSKTTVAALIGLLQDSDSDVRYTAAKAFWNQSTLSETTVAALIGLLQDLDWSVRSAAAKTLEKQSILSKTTVSTLIGLLQDSHSHSSVQSAAAEALGNQSTLSETTVAALIGLLQDSHSSVRSAAAEALGNQSTLYETTVAALIELLQDSDSSVRSAAANALRNQSTRIVKLVGFVDAESLATPTSMTFSVQNNESIKTLYRILCSQGFREQLSWSICNNNNGDYCCVLYIQGGKKEATFKSQAEYRCFLDIVKSIREAPDSSNYKLWDYAAGR